MRPRRTHHARYALTALTRALERAVSNIANIGRVVDYGCGGQPYRDLFTVPGCEYIGADLPSNLQAQLHLGPDGQLPVEDAWADTILSTQVLEHVPDPVRYLAEARRVLRPGGALLLSTHGVWTYHPHPGDYWRWTSAGLARIVESSGFEIVSLEGVLNAASAGLQLWQDSVLSWLPQSLHAPTAFLMQPVIALNDRFGGKQARGRDAGIYIVHARRPNSS